MIITLSLWLFLLPILALINVAIDRRYPFPRQTPHEKNNNSVRISLEQPTDEEVVVQVVVVVTEHNVVGDGIHDDTIAMQTSLQNECPTNKHIVIPKDATVLTYPLDVSSCTTLQIDGTLQAIQSTDDWPILPPHFLYGTSEDRNGGDGAFLTNQYQSFVYGNNVHHVRITGTGIIDGGGSYWWNLFRTAQLLSNAGRPNLIQMINSQHIEIDSVTLQNAPFWTLHPTTSRYVHIHHITIRAPLDAPNTDGINPDASQHVLVEYNDVACGDDHIAIKAGVCGLPEQHYVNHCQEDEAMWTSGRYTTKNVTVRHNVLRRGMGIALGSESSGSIVDVTVYNNTIGVCEYGEEDLERSCGKWGAAMRVKTTVTRSGTISNVVFDSNTVYNTSKFILLQTGYLGGYSQNEVPSLPSDYPKTKVSNIVFRNNLALGGATESTFHCDEIDACNDVQVVNNYIMKSLAGGNNDLAESPWHCEYIASYHVENNYPHGLEECMARSMSPSSDVEDSD